MKQFILSLSLFISVAASAAVMTRENQEENQTNCTATFADTAVGHQKTQKSWTKAILPGALMAATLMSSGETMAQGSALKKVDGRIEVGICGGRKGGTYIKWAQTVALGLSADTNSPWEPKVYWSEGTLDNIDKLLAGVCQVAPVQLDGVEVYKRNIRSAFVPLDVKLEPAFDEQTQVMCHKERQVRSIGNLAEKAANGEKVPIIAPSAQSGFFLTMSNLIASNEKYKEVFLQPALAPKETTDLVRHAVNLAKAQKGCFGIVSRVPDDFITANMDELAADFNVIDLEDKNAKAYTYRDAKGKEVPLYDFVPYSKIRKGQPDLYLPLRRNDSSMAWLTGDFDPKTIVVKAVRVVHADWQQNMLSAIQLPGAQGTVNAWSRSLNTADGLNGNFDPVKYMIEAIEPLEMPQVPR